MSTRLRDRHAPGYDTLTEDERRIADEEHGETSCEAMSRDGWLCTRPSDHDGRHTAFGSKFLGAWEDRDCKRGTR